MIEQAYDSFGLKLEKKFLKKFVEILLINYIGYLIICMPVYFVHIRNYTFRALNEKIGLHTNMVQYTYNAKYALNTNTQMCGKQ